MKGARPKPPKENRAELEDEISRILIHRDRDDAVKFLLKYFTTIDLVGIRDILMEDKDGGL